MAKRKNTNKNQEPEKTDTQTTQQPVQTSGDETQTSGEGTIVDNPLSATVKLTQSPISVVIPYSRQKAQGKELLYAVRSWLQNFRCQFQIVVIGEREDWFEEMGIVFIEMEQSSENPQVNTMEALKLAIASDQVTAKFIWSNDDIYLIAPIGLEHIALPKFNGFLNPDQYKGHYKVNMTNTLELLEDNELPCRNYGTHTPFLYEKEKLVSMLEEHPDLNEGNYLIESVYFNKFVDVRPISLSWATDGFLLPMVSKSPDPDKFAELLNKKVFLNNAESGYSPFLVEQLEQLFPDK